MTLVVVSCVKDVARTGLWREQKGAFDFDGTKIECAVVLHVLAAH